MYRNYNEYNEEEEEEEEEEDDDEEYEVRDIQIGIPDSTTQQQHDIFLEQLNINPGMIMEQRHRQLEATTAAQHDQLRERFRRLRGGEISPEELYSEFHGIEEYNKPTKHNPNPIKIVKDPDLLNKEITSYAWPGMCPVCLEKDHSDLCRVNCSVGHILHCKCLEEHRDSFTEYGWNNKCPVCNEPINLAVHVPPETKLPTEFGKRKNLLKKVDAEIKYLVSL